MANKIVAGEVNLSPATREQAEALIEAYAKSNPDKYKIKLENGEFNKLLAGFPAPEAKDKKKGDK